MSSELFYKIIDECEQMGVMGLTLSGGEPMLNPEFPQWLRELQKRDFYITILSNLTVLTDEIIEEMKKLNSVSVQVSLYSMVPQVHDQITKLPGSWMKTVNSILKLYRLRSATHLSKNKNEVVLENDLLEKCQSFNSSGAVFVSSLSHIAKTRET